jgi:hypothetical protein
MTSGINCAVIISTKKYDLPEGPQVGRFLDILITRWRWRIPTDLIYVGA